MNRIGRAVTALAGATALTLVGALPASAHTITLAGAAVCDTATGTQTVVWSGNTKDVPEGKAADVTVVAAPAGSTVIPTAVGVVGNVPVKFTQTGIPGDAKTASLTGTAKWPSVTAPINATVTLPGDCEQTPAAPTPATMTVAAAADCTTVTATITDAPGGSVVTFLFGGATRSDAVEGDAIRTFPVPPHETALIGSVRLIIPSVNQQPDIVREVTSPACPKPVEPSPTPTPTASATTTPPVKPPTATTPPVVVVPPLYPNCDAVYAAGKAPLLRGQPGYRAGLDSENDGIACENPPGTVQPAAPAPVSPTSPVRVTPAGSSELANTGPEAVVWLALIGGLLVAVGGGTVWAVKRR